MPLTSNPAASGFLGARPAFSAITREELAAALERHLGAEIATLPRSAGIQARANCIKLPLGELWSCAYGVPIGVRFPDGDCARVQFQRAGVGATRVGKESVAVTDTQACISEGATVIDFGADFQQVVWRAPRHALRRKLAAISGSPVTRNLTFTPSLQLDRPQAALLTSILECMVQAAATVTQTMPRIVLEELEQAFIGALLTTSEHSHRALLDRMPRKVAPWQVRRAEGYIAANWDKPITIEALAEVTGSSMRSLFRTFRQARGCSPREFARRVRLEKARTMLEAENAGTTVTEIALRCGFGNPSRFAKDFAKAFGETPSEVLRWSRGRRKPE